MREMKNSGNALIGEIPIERNIVRNKYSIIYEKGKNPKNLNQEGIGNPYIGATELEDINATEYTNYSTDELPMCDKDDVLVLWDGARAGIIGTNHKGAYSSTIVKLTPDKTINKKYFYWYLKAFQKYLYDCTNGTTIPHMNMEYIYDIQMLDWSVNEQKQIADYLDEKCADIDEIISAKEKTNELLKERRQSIITEAVTKGLNPNAEMKDSGIDWIGEIPKHWDTIRLKHLGDAIIGLTYSPMDIVDDGTLVLRSSNIKDGKLVNADNVYVSKDIPEKLKTKKGDILLCSRNGSKALIGKNSVITEDFVGSSFGAFMTIFRSDYNHYLKYVFNSSLFDYYLGTFLTTTINQLTTGNLDSIVIPLPTEEDEMREIESYIESKCGEIDKLIESNNKTIEKLQEYRKSLIYEAVTGKIEV